MVRLNVQGRYSFHYIYISFEHRGEGAKGEEEERIVLSSPSVRLVKCHEFSVNGNNYIVKHLSVVSSFIRGVCH